MKPKNIEPLKGPLNINHKLAELVEAVNYLLDRELGRLIAERQLLLQSNKSKAVTER